MKKSAIKEHFLKNAARLLKNPTGKLKYPFIVPGTGYESDLWDWDSYFTAKALRDAFAVCSREELLAAGLEREKVGRHIMGSVLNFLAAQEKDGYIPVIISGEGDFSHCLNDAHKNGILYNQNKPFLCQSALQAGLFNEDFSWLDANKLELYLKYYENNQYDARSGLFFWQNDIMIGIDNNPTVFYREPRSSADIYLNCFMFAEYESMAQIMRVMGENSELYEQKAERLRQAVNAEMWDARDGLYYSQDVGWNKTEYRLGSGIFHEGWTSSWRPVPLKIRFWGCFLPLYVKLCDKERAERLCEHLRDETIFAAYGIRTLASDEKMYNLEKTSNPSNWLGAIWIIANYLVYEGLRNYGQTELSEKLRRATCDVLENGLAKYGEMFESYHPDSGEPNLYPGFLSWNLLALNMIETGFCENEQR